MNTTLVKIELKQSSIEENQAVKSYLEREKHARDLGFNDVADKYEEILKEERIHRSEFIAKLEELEKRL